MIFHWVTAGVFVLSIQIQGLLKSGSSYPFLFVVLTGIINRGDSFRRRRSRSNSLAPVSPMHTRNAMAGLNGGGGGGSSQGLGNTYNGGGSNSNGFGGESHGQENHQPVEFYRVEMLGSAGVGKQALVSQFRTSDCINAYDGPGNCPNFQLLIKTNLTYPLSLSRVR